MIGLGCMDIGLTERNYIGQVLDSGLVTAGPILSRFEKNFAFRHGRKHGIMVNSGTSALQIALAALKEINGWDDGDGVICPALTFVATSNMIIDQKLTPQWVDVDPQTYTIDPHAIEDAITPTTKAIMVVHLFGLPCDMSPIIEIAKDYGLKVIEDSCESMGVRYEGKPVGSFGDVACFSTYAAHIISTGVGGLAITDDPQIYEVMRSFANHGRNPAFMGFADSKAVNPEKYQDSQNHGDIIEKRFRFDRLGYSHRATQLEAALGLGQLERLDDIIQARKRNAAMLTANLRVTPFMQLPTVPRDREHAFMMYPIVLDDSIERKGVLLELEQSGIETRPFFDIIGQPAYTERFSLPPDLCPISRRLSARGFYVGCHQLLDTADIWAIIAAIDTSIVKHRKVRKVYA